MVPKKKKALFTLRLRDLEVSKAFCTFRWEYLKALKVFPFKCYRSHLGMKPTRWSWLPSLRQLRSSRHATTIRSRPCVGIRWPPDSAHSLVKASCSPDFPPIFLISNFFLEREIHCKQGAIWFSRAVAMQNTLAQQRQVSRSCSFRCDLSENHRPLAKTHGDEFTDPYGRSSAWCSDFCSDFSSDFLFRFFLLVFRRKIAETNQK